MTMSQGHDRGKLLGVREVSPFRSEETAIIGKPVCYVRPGHGAGGRYGGRAFCGP